MIERPESDSKGLVVTALLVIASASIMLASFQYVLVAMQTDLSFSTDSANALAFLPSAASLAVVFVAGSLADRWGPRRLLVIAISLFTAGALLVAVAPDVTWVLLGRILDGIGGVTMAIVALSVVNSEITEPGQRARVFGIYAALTPATFMLAPPVAAVVVQAAGWRAGMVPGIVLGIATLLATLRFVPRRSERGTGELATPLLAGLVLAGIALAVIGLPASRVLSATAAVIAVVSVVALVVLMRRIAQPTLRLGWCRGRGMPILIGVLAVAAMPNLFFYTNLLLQYRYSVPLIEIATLLVVPQAFAVAGGLLSGPVSARIGAPRAAAIALLASALTCLSTLVVTASAPIWVPVLALAVSAAPIAFAVGPLTDTLLSRAPADASGAASSMRKATWTVGNVLGGALIGSAAFGAFQSRLTDILDTDGLPYEEAEIIAQAIRDGAVVDDLAARITDPISRADLIERGPGLLEAQSHAFAVMGAISAALYLAAAALMLWYLRAASAVPHDESRRPEMSETGSGEGTR